jgi:hypothetical protein
MKAHAGIDDPRELVLRFHAKDYTHALIALGRVDDAAPDPYRWTGLTITRQHRKGKRCAVTVVLLHCDSREPRLTLEQAVEHFEGVVG